LRGLIFEANKGVVDHVVEDPSLANEHQTVHDVGEEQELREPFLNDDLAISVRLDRPRTPENRQIPEFNYAPGPKLNRRYQHRETTPTRPLARRPRHRRIDSGYGSRDLSTDELPFDYVNKSDKIEEKDLQGQREVNNSLPKTPTRAPRRGGEKEDSRSASPKRCPSVNRSRL